MLTSCSPFCRESGAILLYLVDTYDKEHKISVSSPRDKATLNQWLFFQASGQGFVSSLYYCVGILTASLVYRPYFGQAAWFRGHHSEHLPSAIERYEKEARRVLGVLESVLSKQEYLVGGKLTIADISFVPYNTRLQPAILGENFKFEEEFPHTAAYVFPLSCVWQ